MTDTCSCDFSNFSCETRTPLACGKSDFYSDENIYVPIYLCSKTTSVHLQSVNAGTKLFKQSIPESLLILYRSGIYELSPSTLKLKICQKHRDHYGIYWKRSRRTCCFPEHPTPSKAKPDRGATLVQCKGLWMNARQYIPVGAGLCKTCSQKIQKTVCDGIFQVDLEDEIALLNDCIIRIESGLGSIMQETVSSVNVPTVTEIEDSMETNTGEAFSQQSSSFTYSQSLASSQEDWVSSNKSQKDKLNEALQLLSNNTFIPLRSQLLTPFEEIQKSTKYYYINKAREAVMIILGIIAPGQEVTLCHEIFKPGNERVVQDKVTMQLIDAYHQATDKRTQLQILSLFVKNFTRQQLITMIPSLTVAKIDAARSHATKNGPGQLINPPKVYRVRLTKPQLLHFLEYVSSPAISQILGFGQTELQLSSGEKIQMPKVIRNAVSARIIDNYRRYCNEIDFTTFSRSSLYRILKACKAAKKKALHGLDNTTANGISALETLTKVVNRLETFGLSGDLKQTLIDTINIVSQHMKFEMKSHFSSTSTTGDHCTIFSLSDAKEKEYKSECDHEHSSECSSCLVVNTLSNQIKNAMSDLNIPNTDFKEELIYDIEIASKHVHQWKAHILRTVHQDQARQDILQNLESNQALVIMDWAMKLLPLLFRETQADFFGKRGLSWHVSCVVTKSLTETDGMDLHSYIHILDNGTQGWFSIAHIINNLLSVLKEHHPQLEEVYLKSDNAGCYHCASILSYICQNNEKFAIRVKEYNFSEPQSGKDLCDSKTGSCRMHVAKYLGEGHDVVTALDLKKALESNGGIKGTHVSVLSIDQDQEPKTQKKIPGISLINNINFRDSDIVVRKAYKVGEGKVLSADSLHQRALDVDSLKGLTVLEPFPERTRAGKTHVSQAPRIAESTEPVEEVEESGDSDRTAAGDKSYIYYCSDPCCTKQYVSHIAFEKHIAIGNHSYRKSGETGIDSAVRIWSEKVTSVRIRYNSIVEKISGQEKQSVGAGPEISQGWALKTTTKSVRFSPRVKKYIHDIFEQCEKTGKRPNYSSLSDEIKKSCDESGQRKFSPHEWLTAMQIRGIFASYMAKQRKLLTNQPTQKRCKIVCNDDNPEMILDAVDDLTSDEQLQEVVEELNAEEFNNSLSSMYNDVYTSVNIS